MTDATWAIRAEGTIMAMICELTEGHKYTYFKAPNREQTTTHRVCDTCNQYEVPRKDPT